MWLAPPFGVEPFDTNSVTGKATVVVGAFALWPGITAKTLEEPAQSGAEILQCPLEAIWRHSLDKSNLGAQRRKLTCLCVEVQRLSGCPPKLAPVTAAISAAACRASVAAAGGHDHGVAAALDTQAGNALYNTGNPLGRPCRKNGSQRRPDDR